MVNDDSPLYTIKICCEQSVYIRNKLPVAYRSSGAGSYGYMSTRLKGSVLAKNLSATI